MRFAQCREKPGAAFFCLTFFQCSSRSYPLTKFFLSKSGCKVNFTLTLCFKKDYDINPLVSVCMCVCVCF